MNQKSWSYTTLFLRYGMWRMYFLFFILGYFLSFYSLTTQKIKILKKTHYHFTHGVPKIMITQCTVPGIWCTTNGRMDGGKKWHTKVGVPPKNGLGLVFSEYFLHNFPIKMFFNKYFINWPSFDVRPTFFLNISDKMFLNSCLANWWHHKLSDLYLINFPSNAWQEEKRGRGKYKNLNIARTKKAFSIR